MRLTGKSHSIRQGRKSLTEGFRFVAQVSNLLCRRLPVGRRSHTNGRPAGWKPAIQQVGNPRHGFARFSTRKNCEPRARTPKASLIFLGSVFFGGVMFGAEKIETVRDIQPQLAKANARDAASTRSEHWSLQPVKSPPLPTVKNSQWPRNEIDYFILARLEKAGLSPSPEADRPILIRRLSYDLLGLPPTPKEIDAFVHDRQPQAYEKLVERLLASPHYGERWGRHWLDVA